MTKVWFNHWFSSAVNIIELVRDKDPDICIIGSSHNPYNVIGTACDEWYSEPYLSGREYVDFCLEFCSVHSVDVFIPRRQAAEISTRITEFENIGVKVMTERSELMYLLADKRSTYEYFSTNMNICVPEYRVFTDRDEFIRCYEELHGRYETLCIKYVKDEGALSFRRITDKRVTDLRRYVSAEVSYDEMLCYLDELGPVPEIMIMPYLSGGEISVDCLDTYRGIIAVPRFKSSGRYEFIRYDEGIISACENIVSRLRPQFPCNIQFRTLNGTPCLLEINPRMSGGIQMGVLASGINIPRLALDKILVKKLDYELNKTECTVSFIERPCVIGGIDPKCYPTS